MESVEKKNSRNINIVEPLGIFCSAEQIHFQVLYRLYKNFFLIRYTFLEAVGSHLNVMIVANPLGQWAVGLKKNIFSISENGSNLLLKMK